ncbi:DUF58 domain-containing protein [Candidatus Pacearchaeota archaeon]|nr:DUF58 domain-containing protein [Candidatus Pacearchaeota archaeon]
MASQKSLNADIAGSIAEFRLVMKEFILKRRLYNIILRGKGLEFDSYREYSQGDDADLIDWKASVRANKSLLRKYRDEKNLKVVFLVDNGENMVFGSSEKLKCEYASEILASLAYLIITSGDKIGFAFFGGKNEDYFAPRGGIKQFHIFIEKLLDPKTYGGKPDINKSLEFVLNYLQKDVSSIVVVSDFLSLDEQSGKKLSLMAKKFETLALMVKDILDISLPDFSQEIIIEDPGTNEQAIINPRIAKRTYESIAQKQDKFLEDTCRKSNIDLLRLITNQRFVPILSEFLKGRIEKSGGKR